MKIRTLEQLEDVLAEELAWRRRELSVLTGQVARSSGPAKDMLIRAGVALLYAHFEGFVKAACEAYVEYVSRQGVQYDRLIPGLRALGLRGRLAEASEAKTMRVWVAFVEFLDQARGRPMTLSTTGAIRTKANLSSTVLAEILMSVGIDFQPYVLKQNLIDRELVDRRNSIAHGRYLSTGEAEFMELYNEVRWMLDTLRTQLSNAAQLREYQIAQSVSSPFVG